MYISKKYVPFKAKYNLGQNTLMITLQTFMFDLPQVKKNFILYLVKQALYKSCLTTNEIGNFRKISRLDGDTLLKNQKPLAIAVKKCAKRDVNLFWPYPIFPDFFTLSLIFYLGL